MAGKIFEFALKINAAMQGNLDRMLANTSAAMRSLQRNAEALASSQSRLSSNIKTSVDAINNSAKNYALMDAAYKNGRISQAAYAAGTQRMENIIRQTTNELQRQETELQRVSALQRRNEFSQAHVRMGESAGRTVGNYQNMVEAANTAKTVAQPFTDAILKAMDFEAAMSKVGAISIRAPKGSAEYSNQLQQLTNKARELGETTQFSASQAAEAMSYLGMAGWNTNQIISGMPGLLALAGASGTALGTVADIVSDDLTAFGLSASDAGHMADVFSYVITRTNTDVSMLGETMKYAAPVAKAFGASMEETAALAGIMANSGIKASQAGTSLRAGFLRLAGPPKKASKEMEALGITLDQATTEAQEAQQALAALGISTQNAGGEQKKMGAILSELRTKTAGLSKEEKIATLGAIFGTNAVTGWLAVLDSSPETFDAMVNEMEKCDGMAAELNQKMMDNAKGGMTQLKSAVESIAISIGSVFLPALASGAKYLAGLAGQFSRFAAVHPGIAKGIAAVGAAVAGSAIGFFALNTAISALSTCKATIGMLHSSMLILEADVLRTTVASTRLSAISTAFSGLTGSVGTFGSLLVAKILGPFKAIGGVVANFGTLIGGKLAGVFAKIGPVIASGVGRIGTMLAPILSTVMSPLRAMIAPLIGIFSGPLTAAFGGIIASFGGLAAAAAPIAAIIAAIVAVGVMLYNNWNTIANVAEVVYNKISAFWQAAMTNLQPAFDSISTSLERLGTVFGSFGANSSLLTEVFNTLGAAITAAFEIAITAVELFVEGFAGALAVVTTIITGIGETITAVANGDWAGAWNSMYNTVASVVDSIISTVSNMVSTVVSSIQSISGLSFGFGGGGSTDVSANAEGGIYNKGAFLTTFAEDGPEAAIPLDGSQRAISLWNQAGQMLGLLPDNSFYTGETSENVSQSDTNFGSILEMAKGITRTTNTDSHNQSISINIPVTINGSADSNTVSDIQSNIENVVRRALENIQNQQRRVALV